MGDAMKNIQRVLAIAVFAILGTACKNDIDQLIET
jgi:hypothetical protein